MKQIIKIIKGSFVGMGSILPGISGSMIAAILKIYQELITALNDFTKHPLKALKSVWEYIVGVIIGLGLGFLFIKIFLDALPIPFTLLFIGFILGAIPGIIKELKSERYRFSHFLVMILMMLMMIGFLFIQEGSSSTNSWIYYVVIFFIGVIFAAALITPGLSGATMLLALGFFQILIDLGDDIIRAFLTLNFTEIAPYIPMLLLLILGAVVGLIGMGKIMYQLLIHFKSHFYFGVLGIVIISPFNILFTLQQNTDENVFNTDWYIWLLGALFFVLGLFLTHIITVKGQKVEEVI
jgi:putative membrane protein